MMRLKLLAAAIVALVVAGPAMAQGQPQQRRRPPEPENIVPPIFVAPQVHSSNVTAAPVLQAENTWVLDLSNGGRVAIQLRPDVAPNHVERIKTLTRSGFYNGIAFHRVVEGFMAQGGDPVGNGTGESTLPDLEPEFSELPHLRGSVAMARTRDPNSANSQFYIMFVPRLSMDGEYTVFGRVVSGMDVVDRIARGDPPAQPTRIVRASLGSDNAPLPTPEEIAAANAPRTPAAPASLNLMNVPSLTGSPTQRPAAPAQAPGTTTTQR